MKHTIVPMNAGGQPKTETVADRVIRLREAMGETPMVFARRLGISIQHMWNIEHGAGLGVETANRMVRTCPGISLDWLFNGEARGLTSDMAQKLAAPVSGSGKRRRRAD